MNAEEPLPRGHRAGIAVLLLALTFALYLGTGRFEFLNYDDPEYVTQNPGVTGGLSLAATRWAFGFHAANWHPLTWLSHQLDVELFGLAPGAMHLVNAGLHALAAALLFLALAELTRATVASALVAALFAAHPLRVQVVAWISERKELLAALFFFALLLAYARYARARSLAAYAAALAALALGSAAKPMLVTAPFVLLLLDVWPLGRLGPGRAGGVHVWIEKLPFLVLAALSAGLTWRAQSAAGAIGELGALSLGERLTSAAAGLFEYLRASVWPSGLAAFYPHPHLVGANVRSAALAGGLALTLSAFAAWRLWPRAPAVALGLCWFLGMLVPVSGLVQVGDQAWADRYAYLPTIGLYVALVFGGAQLLGPRAARILFAVTAAAVPLLAALCLRAQRHWADSERLFTRALAVTAHNWVAHNNLGLVLLERRDAAAARAQFEAALAANPRFARAHYNLGLAHELAGDLAAAEASYRSFLAAQPTSPEVRGRLASLARTRGDHAEAARELEAWAALAPEEPRAWRQLGAARERLGELEAALAAYARALELAPTPEVAGASAWILATGPGEHLLDGPRALELAQRAAEGGGSRALEALAAALARCGDFAAAVAAQERALAALTPDNDARGLEERLALYRAGRPFTRAP
jgi:tetratricopeptide (TPR) repeat protein